MLSNSIYHLNLNASLPSQRGYSYKGFAKTSEKLNNRSNASYHTVKQDIKVLSNRYKTYIGNVKLVCIFEKQKLFSK